MYSNVQLTEEGESCRLKAASQLGLTTLMLRELLKILQIKACICMDACGTGVKETPVPQNLYLLKTRLLSEDLL